MTQPEKLVASNFIRNIVQQDVTQGKNGGLVVTRFPPEPNGYLHIGHAKSICLNFGTAEDFSGKCNLRFDDTNPSKEEQAYADAIAEDVRWLGYQWTELLHASDYFEQLYQYAEQLIESGHAYVDSQSVEEIRLGRGTGTEAGTISPHRNRSREQNLDLFRRMRAGEFKDGEQVLRAKIDMESGNINLRDPVLYRIRHAQHQRTGTSWSLYPMYDYTHCLSDSIEGITHSLCTLEFEDHRPLYDWVLDSLKTPSHPQQIEFARLNLAYTITSKRKLQQLVEEKHVDGWDDPRMPTISGLRRRGFTPAAIRDFCERIGVTKKDSVIDYEVLENTLREDLNQNAQRRMAVLRPLKLVIENYPDGQVEQLSAQNHPQQPELGHREVPFSKTLYIEESDFMEDAPKKFFRLSVGREVRLRYAYYVTCTEVIKNANGDVIEIRCSYDPDSRGGKTADGRKVKGTIHWVSANEAVNAEIRLYERLFNVPSPAAADNFIEHLNPGSLEILPNCKLEPGLATIGTDERFQFERMGYFCLDKHQQNGSKPVFNRSASLRDTWAKQG